MKECLWCGEIHKDLPKWADCVVELPSGFKIYKYTVEFIEYYLRESRK